MLPAPTAGARLVRPPPPTAAHRGTAGTRRAAGFAARTRRGSGFDRAWALGVGAARWVRRSRRAKRAKSDLVESEEVEVKKSQSSYSWEKQWYPVLPLSLLQGVGPEPIKLLNKDLVLWKDGEGEWRCTDGICPHRLAPLARGRVTENGELMCRFHGWCFKGDGMCAKVPMAHGDSEAEGRLIGQDCSKLASYPTKLKKGLLFVWPHASAKEALQREPFVPEELSESPNWSCFDVPAGWRVWLEQSWDPSHAPFLHQYALPNFAPEYAAPMEPFDIQDLGDDGLKVKHGGYMQSNMGMKADRRFVPPCANSTSYLYPDGRIIGFNFYFVPTEPGKVRQITTSYFVPSQNEDDSKSNLKGNMMQMSKVVLKGRSLGTAEKPKRDLRASWMAWAETRWPDLAKVRRGLETWKLLQGLLGDQDNTVLSFQDSVGLPAVQKKELREPRVSQRFGGPASEYLLETHADALVARFDAWIAQRHGGPFGRMDGRGDGGAPREQLEAAVFDRWAAHTSFSKDAQAALSFLVCLADYCDRLVVFSACLAAVALAAAAPRWGAPFVLLAAGATWVARWGRRKAQGFLSALPASPALPRRQLWE
ncbi:unnamed protein product [Durusdinium trenchii]|uniref:Rieske domain-containing protein n=1 Tax=Durusdinium trenchii TaxID=1381693 RepID=A0ABP0R893_9DINO